MSAEEAADKTIPAEASAGDAGDAGDEEEEWLYGDDDEKAEEEEAKLTAAVSAPVAVAAPPESEEAVATGNGVESQEKEAGNDEDSDSDSDDDDDDVRVTIGDIKTGAPQYTTYGAAPVNLNIKTAGTRPFGAGNKLKGVDLEAPGSINGVPVLEVDMESFEEKPWRKPGADLSDYFNYGFNEDTWKAYCEKQKRLRMGLEVVNISSTASKITVQQGRTGNEKEVSLPIHTSKPDFPSPASIYKSAMSVNTTRISPPQWTAPPVQDISYYTKPSGTIDVIGGGTATISRVEGRRRHNLEGNNIQVISEHSSSEAEPTPNKMPPFFPPGPLPPNIPPPPFLPPPPNVSQAPPLLPPPSKSLPLTGVLSHSLSVCFSTGHPGGYDGRPVPPYPFPSGGYPPPMQGTVTQWPPIMDQSKQWDYYPPGKDSTRALLEGESCILGGLSVDGSCWGNKNIIITLSLSPLTSLPPSPPSLLPPSLSLSSSSRRRHDSEEGDGHRRHKHKKSKRSKEGKEPSDDMGPDQENQDGME
uniref:Pre-mRNA 3'-end-processing factor FIP1 n=1 Tax=Esox lucius TaxID=8010 RepID=A0A3P8XX80_ESOLU